MNIIHIVLLSLFFIIALIHITGELLLEKEKSVGFKFRYFSKPLLIPILLTFYLVGNNNISWWIVVALIGGFVGDIFLMIPDPEKTMKWIRIGLFSFLFGHVFYIITFLLYAGEFPYFEWWIVFLILPFIIATAIISPIMIKHAGKMTVPVTAYIIIICLMGISTTFIFIPINHFSIISKVTYLVSVITIYVGAWLFAISDTLNGYGKFVKEFKNERIYTMSTYILGQLSLVLGYTMISTNVIFPV